MTYEWKTLLSGKYEYQLDAAHHTLHRINYEFIKYLWHHLKFLGIH